MSVRGLGRALSRRGPCYVQPSRRQTCRGTVMTPTRGINGWMIAALIASALALCGFGGCALLALGTFGDGFMSGWKGVATPTVTPPTPMLATPTTATAVATESVASAPTKTAAVPSPPSTMYRAPDPACINGKCACDKWHPNVCKDRVWAGDDWKETGKTFCCKSYEICAMEACEDKRCMTGDHPEIGCP